MFDRVRHELRVRRMRREDDRLAVGVAARNGELERERRDRLFQAIREQDAAASTIYVSHGADGDWFVVEPQVGTEQSIVNTPITTEMAVESLLEAGRTVYRLDRVSTFEDPGDIQVFDADEDGHLE